MGWLWDDWGDIKIRGLSFRLCLLFLLRGVGEGYSKVPTPNVPGTIPVSIFELPP